VLIESPEGALGRQAVAAANCLLQGAQGQPSVASQRLDCGEGPRMIDGIDLALENVMAEFSHYTIQSIITINTIVNCSQM
jgi:hypothetical protein